MSQPTNRNNLERVIEVLLEAARRANWDAQHGPRHLRSGRFFISDLMSAHAFREADDAFSMPAEDSNESAGAKLPNSDVEADGFGTGS